ncbi:MAG: hypothetical protein IJT91_03500 [Clostridia bacterium]|nr:hypothetical protein [Clostridia bacterium]
MKKIKLLTIFVTAVMLIGMLSVFSSAELDVRRDAFTTVIGTPSENGLGLCVANNNTPTLDGSITDGEGWSTPYVFNNTNMNQGFWSPQTACVISGTLRFAWDTTNLYIAADIADPSYIMSTGDGTDLDDGDFLYNGDVFVFTIDPMVACLNSGMTQSDYNMWYYISNHENSFSCKSMLHEGSPSDKDYQGAVKTTDAGWAFECGIPWSDIVEDTQNASLSSAGSDIVEVQADEVAVKDVVSDCAIIYMDRAKFGGEFSQLSSDQSLDEGTVFSVGKLASTPVTLRDGMAPSNYSDVFIKSYGIRLALGDAAGATTVTPDNIAEEIVPEVEEITTEAATEAEDETDDTAKAVETEKETEEEETTTEAKEEKTEETKEAKSSNTGLIIGIIAAVVVVAAVVVFIVLKKKKAQ